MKNFNPTEYYRQYRKNNKDIIKKIREKSYQKNKEKIIASNKKWKEKNKDKCKLYSKNSRWALNNPERRREIQKKSYTKRRKNPQVKLYVNMSCGIRKSLLENKAGKKWEDLVGYTIKQLKKHLEKRFLPGMTWGNYGKWHIDHKIPNSVFNYNSPEDIDFKRCWSLKNLQPLWAKDNESKGNKLTKPHQPSLLI